MRENRLSGSMRGEARRSLAPASHSVRFAYSTCASEVGCSWVKVPTVELDGSRPKRSIRDEAVRPNHKRDAGGTVGS
jgi:hypothetical protein